MERTYIQLLFKKVVSQAVERDGFLRSVGEGASGRQLDGW